MEESIMRMMGRFFLIWVLLMNVFIISLFAGGEQEATITAEGEIGGELIVFIEPTPQDFRVVNEAFEERYPQVELKFDSANATEYETILKTRLAAGDYPDIMTFWPNARTADPAKRGIIRSLSDTEYAQRIVSSLKSEVSYQGKVYGVPSGGQGEGIFINKNLFDEQGLDIPTNWSEFLDSCAAFNKAGIQPIASGFKDDWTIMRYTNAAFATLGYGQDPEFEEKLICGEADFSFEGWVETFDKFQVLVENKYFGKSSLAIGHDQALAKFARGEAAMWFMGTWDAVGIRDGMTEEFGIVYDAPAVNDEGQKRYGCWRAGNVTTISAKTENLPAANAYLETFADQQVHAQYCKETGSYPVFEDVEIPNIDSALDAYVEKYVLPGNAMPGAHYKWPAGMSNNWKKKLQEIASLKITTDEMVEWLNQEYQSMENLYECSR